jgi:hypothetical protein
MNELPFRNIAPQRTYKGRVHANYRAYKKYLAEDFNQKCGYTDCSHVWFGGKDNFHIDHFIPWKRHLDKPELKTQYSNLVYSCSYVNIAKSDDEGNYIDPCETDFNQHFYRDSHGNIYPKDNSDTAKYMYKNLKLFLKRYGIIWILEQLEQRMYKLQELIEKTDDAEAKTLFVKIGMMYNNYKKYLRAIQ